MNRPPQVCKWELRLPLVIVLIFFAAVGLSSAKVEAASAVAQPSAGSSLDKVRLQLKWTHQFQFTGFYAAIEKGYYSDVGLDVELVECLSGVDFIKLIADGEA